MGPIKIVGVLSYYSIIGFIGILPCRAGIMDMDPAQRLRVFALKIIGRFDESLEL
jgi:hypothetical protein